MGEVRPAAEAEAEAAEAEASEEAVDTADSFLPFLMHSYVAKEAGGFLYFKRFAEIVLALAFFISVVPPAAEKNADAVSTSASSAILMCADSGEILYEQNSHEKRSIASITKIMTAVIALEQPDDQQVKFTLDMAAEGTSMYLKEGEILTLSELTKGMMTVSGNDAANAIAVSVAGSREKFADLMNEKAKQIGMTDTHFVTPSGLDDEMHYSTAYDMAILCRYAMNQPKFAEIVSQKSISVKYVYPEGKTQLCVNHNKLLSYYDGCIGIKTGYTSKAGRTLTSCAERDGVRLIAVTLNDGNDWNDHTALFDYGFSCVERKCLTDNIDIFLPVVGSDKETVHIVPEKECSVSVIKGSDSSITERICLPRFVYAPVKKGRSIGEVNYYKNGVIIAHTRLIADEGVTDNNQEK